ncbi:MAG: hypothetical protein K2X81_24480 [Candidatus Obscuribacterales bacterium]|nr:hypothetical protein [Candidatus Obscuribacterales bacterium]
MKASTLRVTDFVLQSYENDLLDFQDQYYSRLFKNKWVAEPYFANFTEQIQDWLLLLSVELDKDVRPKHMFVQRSSGNYQIDETAKQHCLAALQSLSKISKFCPNKVIMYIGISAPSRFKVWFDYEKQKSNFFESQIKPVLTDVRKQAPINNLLRKASRKMEFGFVLQDSGKVIEIVNFLGSERIVDTNVFTAIRETTFPSSPSDLPTEIHFWLTVDQWSIQYRDILGNLPLYRAKKKSGKM